MYIRPWTQKASDGRTLKNFEILQSLDKILDRTEIIELSTEPQLVEVVTPQLCPCKKHLGYAEGVVKIRLYGNGSLHWDWSGVKDPEFSCESKSSDSKKQEAHYGRAPL